MIYSFKQGELTCIKKIFGLENLHGVGTPLWAGFFDKRRLLNSDVIEKHGKEYVFTSLYKELFNEWTNMDYVITFFGQGKYEVDKHVLMTNSRRIITLEEDLDIAMVGYYYNEAIGLRNYIIDHLNVRFDLKAPKEMKFRIVLNKNDYELFMNCDDNLFAKLSEEHNVHQSVFNMYVNKLKSKNVLKTIMCKDVKTSNRMKVDLVSDKNANYVLKREFINDEELYVLSICDSEILPFEIQNI